MASVLPPLPGWLLWLPSRCLDFPCCDPVGDVFFSRGAFFGGGGLPLCLFGPQCSILLHLEHLESLAGQLVLLAGCCHVQFGQSLGGAGDVWPSPSWLVWAPQHLSWRIVYTGLELWETCSHACLMAKWFTVMSVSSLEGVLKDLTISLSRNIPSWW